MNSVRALMRRVVDMADRLNGSAMPSRFPGIDSRDYHQTLDPLLQ